MLPKEKLKIQGKLTVNRFIYPIDTILSIRDARQARARQQAQTARNHACLVTDDIPEQIACNNDPVQGARVLHHQHGC